MKKKLIIIIASIAAIIIIICLIDISKAPDPGEVKTSVSFGNQFNSMLNDNKIAAVDGDWLYSLGKDRTINRIRISSPGMKEKVYTEKNNAWTPSHMRIADGWIYFIDSSDGKTGGPLCKIKKDGSNKKVLIRESNSFNYILTKTEIYYEGTLFRSSGDQDTYYTGWEKWLYNYNIYARNLEKGGKRVVLRDVISLDGIDNGWIYCSKGINGDIYRVRPDGSGLEKVMNGKRIEEYIIDNGQMYYIRSYIKDKYEMYSLIKRTGEKETVLATIKTWTGSWFLNKEGDWLYYADWNKVYRVNVKDRSRKELVYKSSKDDCVGSIQLDDGAVLVTFDKKTVYIDRQGEATELKDSPLFKEE